MKLRTAWYIGILVTFFFTHAPQAYALYDPRSLPVNKVGVHILHPSELETAAKLVNSQGGDWGYVTVPIQPTDRDIVKWKTFMEQCIALHLIPIIRITTIPQGGTWESGQDTDLVDFANFLNGLPWPIENRYIVLFNEVNRDAEWGGAVNPAKYTSIVKNARAIFKERSPDFFLLGPALDDSLPDSLSSMSAKNYLLKMASSDPAIWSYFDGWASHSYPNPGFVASPSKTGSTSITSYSTFQKMLKLVEKPVFITETGWDQTKLSAGVINSYWSQAWKTWNSDPNVVAVTPFVLSGGDAFAPLSLTDSSGNLTLSGQALSALGKQKGAPRAGSKTIETKDNLSHQIANFSLPWFKNNRSLLKLENIFRLILGLPQKSLLIVKDVSLTVELAQTPKDWEKGLSNRASLDQIDGMLFVFPYAHIPVFWMKDMNFPLDMIWVSDSIIVDITPDVPLSPTDKLPTYSPQSPVNKVLEVPAGWSAANNIKIGDTLTL